jgi:hypothetical protein
MKMSFKAIIALIITLAPCIINKYEIYGVGIIGTLEN